MFVELSILEPMRKKFPPCAKMRKKIDDWNGKRTHCRILATSLSRLAATSTDRPPLDKFCITFISTPASLSHLIYYFFHPESCQKEKNFFICQKEKNFFRSTMAKSCITFISTTASPVLFWVQKKTQISLATWYSIMSKDPHIHFFRLGFAKYCGEVRHFLQPSDSVMDNI